MTDTPRARSVLIVEENAHWLLGHFPGRFAQVAAGYVELGFRTEVLTTWDWSRAAEAGDVPFEIHRFGPLARQVRRLGSRLRSAGHSSAPRRLVNSLGDAAALSAMVGATRSRARRMTPRPDVIVIFGWHTEPNFVAAIAGPGRWLVNQFRPPDEVLTWRSPTVIRAVRGAAARAEHRRASRGGKFRLATADEPWRREWAVSSPSLDPVVLPIAGVGEFTPLVDPRTRLGIPADARVALFFGANDAKRIDTVLAAFAALPDWTLLIGGEIADEVPEDAAGPRTRRFPGVVDNETRDLLISAADLMVLSFVEDYRRNSGTLMDAISAGLPSVCSRGSAAAEIVDLYAVGELFEPGDADSLVEAVERAPRELDPGVLTHARSELSNRGVARQQLRALGLEPPDGPPRIDRASTARPRSRIRRRRFRVFGIGNPKSGTTTIPHMFSDYRAAHEVDAKRFVPLVTAVLAGRIDANAPQARYALRRRSARYNLEVDSANFLTPFAGTLAQLYPEARFILTIRDCFSWLDSRVERMVRYPPIRDQPWFREYLTALYDGADQFHPEEASLRDAGLRPVASYLRAWNAYNAQALREVPSERLLVVKTEDLDDSASLLAAFAGVPESTVRPAHANRSPASTGRLAEVPRSFVEAQARVHCGDLMERYWGRDWLELADRIPPRP